MLEVPLYAALMLLTLLQVKHLFADFFLQSPRMLAKRAVYLHWGRVEHAGLHAILSFVSLLIIGAPLIFSAILSVLEWIVHYHIDWAKGRHSEQKQHGPSDAGYWRAFGVDQLMHQLTYVVMLWAWAIFAV